MYAIYPSTSTASASVFGNDNTTILLTWHCLIVVPYLFRETDTLVALKYLIIRPYLSRKAIPRNEPSTRSFSRKLIFEKSSEISLLLISFIINDKLQIDGVHFLFGKKDRRIIVRNEIARLIIISLHRYNAEDQELSFPSNDIANLIAIDDTPAIFTESYNISRRIS